MFAICVVILSLADGLSGKSTTFLGQAGSASWRRGCARRCAKNCAPDGGRLAYRRPRRASTPRREGAQLEPGRLPLRAPYDHGRWRRRVCGRAADPRRDRGRRAARGLATSASRPSSPSATARSRGCGSRSRRCCCRPRRTLNHGRAVMLPVAACRRDGRRLRGRRQRRGERGGGGETASDDERVGARRRRTISSAPTARRPSRASRVVVVVGGARQFGTRRAPRRALGRRWHRVRRTPRAPPPAPARRQLAAPAPRSMRASVVHSCALGQTRRYVQTMRPAPTAAPPAPSAPARAGDG